MKCKYCGTENPNGFKTCQVCGEELKESIKEESIKDESIEIKEAIKNDTKRLEESARERANKIEKAKDVTIIILKIIFYVVIPVIFIVNGLRGCNEYDFGSKAFGFIWLLGAVCYGSLVAFIVDRYF